MKEDLRQDLLITKWSTAVLLVQATVFSRLHYAQLAFTIAGELF